MADQYDTTPIVAKTKQEVHEAYETMSDYQKGAFNQVVTALRDWQGSPNAAWFGSSLRKDIIDQHIRELARQYGLDAHYQSFATYPAYKRANITDKDG